MNATMQARGLRPVAELSADRPHGDRLRYMAGCKCFHCRRSNSDYERERQAARLAGDWNGIVDAHEARTHILRLSRKGIGRDSIHAACDVAVSVLCDIRSGKKKRVRARTARKILAVTVAAIADKGLVPAARTWRLIDELLTEGFTAAFLASQLGYKHRLARQQSHFASCPQANQHRRPR